MEIPHGNTTWKYHIRLPIQFTDDIQ
ncbi:MAG: hypothetical protein HMLIMOIP_000254 [Candidatus Nitrosomirales archaeon]|jgi:hypothetical protein